MRYLLVLFLNSVYLNICLANDTDTAPEKKYQYVNISKPLSWLSDKTRIFSMDIEVIYESNIDKKIIKLEAEDKMLAPLNEFDCAKYDVEDKYSNYFYYIHQNIVEEKELPLSNKFDGYKLDGRIIQKTTVFCFAD